MRFLILIILANGIACAIRLLCIFLKRVFKVNSNTKSYVVYSITSCAAYLECYLGIAKNMATKKEFNSLEWYLLYAFIGVVLVLWCYFSWELKLISIPHIHDARDKRITIKKIILYSVIVVVSFVYGYCSLNKMVTGQDINTTVIILNATIIPGIIALDRLLNQVVIYRK